jgi:hypothetical protein
MPCLPNEAAWMHASPSLRMNSPVQGLIEAYHGDDGREPALEFVRYGERQRRIITGRP